MQRLKLQEHKFISGVLQEHPIKYHELFRMKNMCSLGFATLYGKSINQRQSRDYV